MNDKIRAASQSNNYVTQALYQKLKTSKWTLKTVRLTLNRFTKTTIEICFNLLQVCPSVPAFVFALLLFIPSFHVLNRFLCLQWVLFLFEAGCSLSIKDEIILYLPHKILWLMFSSPWLFFIKTRSLCQIFSSNVANFSCYQNSMATLLMQGFYLGVVDSIKSWRSKHIVFRKIINVILTLILQITL